MKYYRKLFVAIILAMIFLSIMGTISMARDKTQKKAENKSSVQVQNKIVKAEGDIYEYLNGEKIPVKGVDVGGEVLSDMNGHYEIMEEGKHHLFFTLGNISNASAESQASISHVLQYNGYDYDIYKVDSKTTLPIVRNKILNNLSNSYFTSESKLLPDDQETSRKNIIENAFSSLFYFDKKINENNECILGESGEKLSYNELKDRIKDFLYKNNTTLSTEDFKKNVLELKQGLSKLEESLSIEQHTIIYRVIMDILDNDIKKDYDNDTYLYAYNELEGIRSLLMTEEENKYFTDIYNNYYKDIEEKRIPGLVLPLDTKISAKTSLFKSLDTLRESEIKLNQDYYSIEDFLNKANNLSKEEKEKIVNNLKMLSDKIYGNVDMGVVELEDGTNPYESMKLPYEIDIKEEGYTRVHIKIEELFDYPNFEGPELPEGAFLLNNHVYKVTKWYYVSSSGELVPISDKREIEKIEDIREIEKIYDKKEITNTFDKVKTEDRLPENKKENFNDKKDSQKDVKKKIEINDMPTLGDESEKHYWWEDEWEFPGNSEWFDLEHPRIDSDGSLWFRIIPPRTTKDGKMRLFITEYIKAWRKKKPGDEENNPQNGQPEQEPDIPENEDLPKNELPNNDPDIINSDEILDHIETNIYIYNNYSLKHDLVLQKNENFQLNTEVKATGLRVLLNDGTVLIEKKAPFEEDESVLLAVLDDNISHGATIQVEYTIEVSNNSPYTCTHLELINYLPEGFNYFEDSDLITENKTNSTYRWRNDSIIELNKQGFINGESLMKFGKNSVVTINMDNENKFEKGFYISPNGKFTAKVVGTSVIASADKIKTSLNDYAEVLGYKAGFISGKNSNGSYQKYEARRMTLTSNNSKLGVFLTGIYPGNAEEMDFSKNKNHVLIVPPTGKKVQLIYSIIMIIFNLLKKIICFV